MKISEIISCYTRLGRAFSDTSNAELDFAVRRAEFENHWFTNDNILFALNTWSSALQEKDLENWLLGNGNAELPIDGKKTGIIMAGNVPLVGLHDLLTVLASGHKAVVKLSSDDKPLMLFVIHELQRMHPFFKENIIVADRLNNMDAIIATGSNNSARYFEYYFKNIPSVIRKNRNSVAVLSGNESGEELTGLGWDIFRYYGKGCRNITHLYFPKGYNIATFYDGIAGFDEVINHNKYANNYTYHKALFLMNQQAHFDNNFLLTKEDETIYSPIGCVNFSFYESEESLKEILERSREQIQVIAGNPVHWKGSSPFGSSQKPSLDDYADGINTLEFCRNL